MPLTYWPTNLEEPFNMSLSYRPTNLEEPLEMSLPPLPLEQSLNRSPSLARRDLEKLIASLTFLQYEV